MSSVLDIDNPLGILNPITFTSSMLTNSTVPENDYTAWNSGTAYIVGDKVILVSTHKIYECLIAHTNASPDVNSTGTGAKWLVVGATNRHKMFDEKFGTQTTATSSITVVITPNLSIDSISLLNLTGNSVTISSTVGGTTIYSRTIALQTDIGVYDWKTYFLAPIVAEDDVVVTDLLPYTSQVITVTITGVGTVGIGSLIMGAFVEIGSLEAGAEVSIDDYSKFETDAFGDITVTVRAYRKRFSGRVIVNTSFVDQLSSLLASIRSVPVVWVGNGTVFSSLIVWGFYKDFKITIDSHLVSYCTLTIEGLV